MYVHLHHNTYFYDEYERVHYDDDDNDDDNYHVWHDTRRSLYLLTFSYSQLARPCRPRGYVSLPGESMLARVGRV